MAVDHIIEAKRRQSDGKSFVRADSKFKCDTLFDHLVASGLPEDELSVERLASEAQVVMGAGTVTTARSMDHLAVHILLNERVHQRLRKELEEPMAEFPEKLPDWTVLEKLPYLQACIKEGLRYMNFSHSATFAKYDANYYPKIESRSYAPSSSMLSRCRVTIQRMGHP